MEYLANFQNVDELLDFMVQHVNNYNCPTGIVKFQGEDCEISGMNPGPNPYVIVSPKYDRTVFLLNDDGLPKDKIKLCVLVRTGRIDELYGIILPEYINAELIFTCTGEW